MGGGVDRNKAQAASVHSHVSSAPPVSLPTRRARLSSTFPQTHSTIHLPPHTHYHTPSPRSGLTIEPLSFPGSGEFTIESAALLPAMDEARVHKSAQEVELFQYVGDVGSRAHIEMMKVGVRDCECESVRVSVIVRVWECEIESAHIWLRHGCKEGCRVCMHRCVCYAGGVDSEASREHTMLLTILTLALCPNIVTLCPTLQFASQPGLQARHHYGVSAGESLPTLHLHTRRLQVCAG